MFVDTKYADPGVDQVAIVCSKQECATIAIAVREGLAHFEDAWDPEGEGGEALSPETAEMVATLISLVAEFKAQLED